MGATEALKLGETAEVAFLRTDFAGSTPLKLVMGESASKPLLDDWQQHAERAVAIEGGHKVSWGGDGGWFYFRGDSLWERALKAAVHLSYYPVLRMLTGTPGVGVRVALHVGVFEMTVDSGSIKKDEVDLVHKLEAKCTPFNGISASGRFLRKCSETVRGVFRLSGEYQGEPVQVTTLAQIAGLTLGKEEPARQVVEASWLQASDITVCESGVINSFTAVDKCTVENRGDRDVVLAEMRVTYFNAGHEVGSRVFPLGSLDAKPPIFPRQSKVSLHRPLGKEMKIAARAKVAGLARTWIHSTATEMPGKADSATITFLGAQAL